MLFYSFSRLNILKISISIILSFIGSWNTSFANEIKSPVAVFIYGTSCAGKSTLASNLLKTLGEGWCLIDRDEVIEDRKRQLLLTNQTEIDEMEARADDYVLEEMAQARIRQQNVIVDTQLHQNILNQIKDYQTLSILVYAPIPLLLERNQKRNTMLNRPEKRQYYAKAYILNTFANLFSLEGKGPTIDRIMPGAIKPEFLSYCDHTETHAFFDHLCRLSRPCAITCREYFDICIHSRSESIETSINQIKLILYPHPH